MAERFLQKVSNTNLILDKPTASGIASKSGDIFVNNGTDVRALARIITSGITKVAGGETALDGSNPTTVATGLSTIVAAFAVLKGSSAPADGTSVVTVNFSTGGNLDIYGWKNTGGTDPTLVASTGTDTVEWFAIGS